MSGRATLFDEAREIRSGWINVWEDGAGRIAGSLHRTRDRADHAGRNRPPFGARLLYRIRIKPRLQDVKGDAVRWRP